MRKRASEKVRLLVARMLNKSDILNVLVKQYMVSKSLLVKRYDVWS